jgi:hypothetical protein
MKNMLIGNYGKIIPYSFAQIDEKFLATSVNTHAGINRMNRAL